MKKIKVIIICIFIGILVASTFKVGASSLTQNATWIQSTSSTLTSRENKERGTVYYATDLYSGTKDENSIKFNTKYLQELIDNASEAGGGIVHIPAGVYYFASAGANQRGNEEYVIRCRNNVTIEGEGTNESNYKQCTILKPYGEVTLINEGGLDMFYFNDYEDYRTETYLENADFRNFIIDSEEAIGKGYNSSGKGFMFLLVKNCDYENIIVKNTDGTGFGMDCPINCTIKNCIAVDCGKAAEPSNVGGSGFGIGTGYSNEESIHISNCIALGNKKFGFFFEHQGRFSGADKFPATESSGFVVSNCIASGNMYDFGGARANDVTYENCVSNDSYINEKVTNVSSLHFESMSRRIHMVNCTVEQKFTDVTETSRYYYEPVYWALNNAITNGTSKTTFEPTRECSNAQAMMFLWRMAERPGDVVYGVKAEVETNYNDVESDSSYADAVKWAAETGIINTQNTEFSPNEGCTRAMFITWLWKYAGKPIVETEANFIDVPKGAEYEDAVNWATSKGILKGTSATKFSPNAKCKRAEAVTFLYRYSNTKNNFSITYNLNGGETMQENPISYQAGEDAITLRNPVKLGYTFLGWTGSGYTSVVNKEDYIPKKIVTITKDDVGNKTYTANWTPNSYIVSFNANGGKGQMADEYFTYDAVQTLSENEFTRTNYKFKGWNTRADGKGKSYSNAEAVKNLTANRNGQITLYAQWESTIQNKSKLIVVTPPTRNYLYR